ncbi:MAG: DUF1318 domain-containing protein [Candidatus Omnitrophica bacterium]|nr:DUF1318 domain-containing protein [Candidatus Omnitrophota bacterium]
MNKYLILLAGLVLALGCARIRVEAPKEAIKLDVAMRLDIYQHVEKDIDQIENMISGQPEKPKPSAKDNHSLLECFISTAHAQEGLGSEVEEAVMRRKDRRPELVALEEKGIIGENNSGLVEVRAAQPGAQALVEEENNDRMVIYKAVAEKNGTSVDEVQHLYAKRLQTDAPAGTPVQQGSDWIIK